MIFILFFLQNKAIFPFQLKRHFIQIELEKEKLLINETTKFQITDSKDLTKLVLKFPFILFLR